MNDYRRYENGKKRKREKGEKSMLLRLRCYYLFWARIYWPVGHCATCQRGVIDPYAAVCGIPTGPPGVCALTRSGQGAPPFPKRPCFSCSLCGSGLLRSLPIPTPSLLAPRRSRWLFATANPPPLEQEARSGILIPARLSRLPSPLSSSSRAAPEPGKADRLL